MYTFSYCPILRKQPSYKKKQHQKKLQCMCTIIPIKMYHASAVLKSHQITTQPDSLFPFISKNPFLKQDDEMISKAWPQRGGLGPKSLLLLHETRWWDDFKGTAREGRAGSRVPTSPWNKMMRRFQRHGQRGGGLGPESFPWVRTRWNEVDNWK